MKETPAYRVGELVFLTIREAQKKEIGDLVADGAVLNDGDKIVIERIIEHTDEVVAILTFQPKSTPRKPRSDIGKKRAAKGATPALL